MTLNNIIQKNFPEEYAERRSEHESLTNPGVDLLPLFVMDVILPCQKFQLNIFEPRYRLMVSWILWDLFVKTNSILMEHIQMPFYLCLKQVRRIMEGNRRMGMVGFVTTPFFDFFCFCWVLAPT